MLYGFTNGKYQKKVEAEQKARYEAKEKAIAETIENLTQEEKKTMEKWRVKDEVNYIMAKVQKQNIDKNEMK